MFTVWVRMGTQHNAASMAGKSWEYPENQYVLDLRLQECRKDLVIEIPVFCLLAVTTSQFLVPIHE